MTSSARPLLLASVVAALAVAGCTAPEEPGPPVPAGPGGTTGTGAGTNATGNQVPGNVTGPGPGGPSNATGTNGTGTNATGTNATGNQTGPGGAAPAGVDVMDNLYQPSSVSVAAGQTVRFSNVGQALHSVTIEAPDGSPLVDEDIDPGEALLVEFPDPGTYKLRCKYHSDGFAQGQVGTVVAT